MHFIHLLKQGHSFVDGAVVSIILSLLIFLFIVFWFAVWYQMLVGAPWQLASSPVLCTIAVVLLFTDCPNSVCIGIFCVVSDVHAGRQVRKPLWNNNFSGIYFGVKNKLKSQAGGEIMSKRYDILCLTICICHRPISVPITSSG